LTGFEACFKSGLIMSLQHNENHQDRVKSMKRLTSFLSGSRTRYHWPSLWTIPGVVAIEWTLLLTRK
jgi:hypothetical protein